MRSNPQRLAWITLLGALALFCLLCVSSVIFARWLLFESPTQLSVTLHVARGTVGVSKPDTSGEQAVRTTDTVGQENTLSTDNDSQGYLAFADPYSGQVLATVTLHHDSVMTLDRASRPRFSLSDNPYSIRVTGIVGRVDVWVNGDLDRELRLDLVGPLGTILVSEPGTLFVESTADFQTVTARDGTAILVSYTDQTQHIAPSTKATLYRESPNIEVASSPIELLPNSDFRQSEDWPVGWSCAFRPSPDNLNGPAGQWLATTVDGRTVMHIQRMQPEPGPGRTGCVQYLAGPRGQDVTGYATVSLRATMRVQYQSLSACGDQGSECPVMLHMVYLDPAGNELHWYHGFYTKYTPNVGRTRCDSCLEPHEQISENAWYTYELEDLFADLPTDRRPGSIIEIEFYGEGHQYDVLIDELSLLATLPDEGAPSVASQSAAP
ncbi:MAG: hypothetical protein GX573_02925 [Chloroflexi bacterium]|nr:hypothetical protein [Chloroflexota bacterium]